MTPTCLGLRPTSGGLQLSLAKVILILRRSVRLLFGGVAACTCAPNGHLRRVTKSGTRCCTDTIKSSWRWA